MQVFSLIWYTPILYLGLHGHADIVQDSAPDIYETPGLTDDDSTVPVRFHSSCVVPRQHIDPSTDNCGSHTLGG